MLKYLYIIIGGSLGAVARYVVGVLVTDRLGGRFPFGTLIINITACVAIGFSIVYLGRRTELSAAWRYLIPVGFIGSYSTFSTFEWETFSNMQAGAFMISALYLALSIVLGLLAVWGGAYLARAIS